MEDLFGMLLEPIAESILELIVGFVAGFLLSCLSGLGDTPPFTRKSEQLLDRPLGLPVPPRASE
jgi:hypothetical protein